MSTISIPRKQASMISEKQIETGNGGLGGDEKEGITWEGFSEEYAYPAVTLEMYSFPNAA